MMKKSVTRPSWRLHIALVLLGSSVLLGACSSGDGGGGGGGGGTPATPTQNVTVTKNGDGTVTSSPSGINCGTTCSAPFTENSQVALSPTATQAFVFSGWSGACSGSGNCAITISSDPQANSVHAVFSAIPNFNLTVTTSGSGTVTSSPAGINQCSGICTTSFTQGTQVTLTATPAQGFLFNSWGGGCSGNAPLCTVTMTTDIAVQAIFSAAAGFDFSLDMAPSTQSGAQGGTISYTVTATLLNGPANPVTLTVQSGCPAGASCTFSDNPITPTGTGTTSLLTVILAVNTPIGTSPLVVRGTAGALLHETSAQLTVATAVPPSPNPPRFAYVANSSDSTISIYTVNATTGQLRHNGYINAGSLPLSLVLHPTKPFLYLASQEPTGKIHGYAANATTGQLTPVPNSPVSAGSFTDFVATHPSGNFLYAVNQGLSGGQPTVSAYQINQTTGELTAIGTPVATGTFPTSIAITPNGQFAYVANFASSGPQISAYTILANGTLQPLALTGIPINPASAITVDPTGRFLYTANEIFNNVSAYAIAANGTLSSLGTKSAGEDPSSIAVDPSGKFVYVGNETSGTVTGYAINQVTGVLTQVPGSPFLAGTAPSAVTVDTSGHFVYVTNKDSNSVTAFSLDLSTGTLTRLGTTRTRQQPASIAILKGSQPVSYTPTFAYVANQGSNSLSGFSINPSTGELSATVPSTATSAPSSVAILPNGKFLYAPNQLVSQNGQVSGFSIDPTGALIPVPNTPSTGTSPHGAAADPSSRFVYVVNRDSTNLSAFTVTSATGTLIPNGSTGTDGSPVSVSVDPTGQFLYVANRTGGTVRAYKIDSSAGTLTGTGATPNPGNNPEAVTVDPTGRFVYMAASANGKVYGFNVDAVSGGLTAIPGSPFTAGTFPIAVATEPTGKFLFVANRDANSLSVFRIDASTGVLSSAGPAVAVGTRPDAVTVDVSGTFVYVGVLGPANPVGPGTVAGFSLNLGTGSLAAVPSSPFGVGIQPVSVGGTGTIQ